MKPKDLDRYVKSCLVELGDSIVVSLYMSFIFILGVEHGMQNCAGSA